MPSINGRSRATTMTVYFIIKKRLVGNLPVSYVYFQPSLLTLNLSYYKCKLNAVKPCSYLQSTKLHPCTRPHKPGRGGGREKSKPYHSPGSSFNSRAEPNPGAKPNPKLSFQHELINCQHGVKNV